MISKKGEKSLQMIISLMILLVVAAVVINIFINYVGPEELEPGASIVKEEFRQSCNALCDSYEATGDRIAAINYCTEFADDIDWNENQVAPERDPEPVDTGIWKGCEDRIYCFLVSDCELDVSGCRDFLCHEYRQEFGEEGATQRLKDNIELAGDNYLCELLDEDEGQVQENWYWTHFESVDYCNATFNN